MSERMIEVYRKHKYILIIILAAALFYAGVTIVVQEKLEDLANTIEVQVTEQRALLTTIAETTARNGADEVTETIVRDCTVNERTKFDELLGNLDKGLSQTELIELERLFGRCGSFFAERKSVMVARLVREIEIYNSYVDQLRAVTTDAAYDEHKVDAWKRLAAEEEKQSQLFSEMVKLQDEIITTLLSGRSADSDEIKTILAKVRETQETLIVTNKQAATVRAEVISL